MEGTAIGSFIGVIAGIAVNHNYATSAMGELKNIGIGGALGASIGTAVGLAIGLSRKNRVRIDGVEASGKSGN